MILSTRRPIKLPNIILKSALGLKSLWPNHTIKHVRSWWTRIQVMASYMTAPSHYLKQCGLIIKLINKVLWHSLHRIIIKDLKIPISKMRLKLVCWDNFTPSPKIIHLFSSDFVCHGGKLLSIVTSFNPSGLCLLKGNKVPSPCVFCDHTTGGAMSQELTCCMRSQSHERSWPTLLKLKFGNG